MHQYSRAQNTVGLFFNGCHPKVLLSALKNSQLEVLGFAVSHPIVVPKPSENWHWRMGITSRIMYTAASEVVARGENH